MKTIAVSVALMLALFTPLNNMLPKYDNSVLAVLRQLDCPSDRRWISDTEFCSSKPIEASNLVFVQAWYDDKGVVELYAGSEGGYLAVLRNDHRIHCAQYINGVNADDIDLSAFERKDIYFYEKDIFLFDRVFSIIKTAYCLDGKALNLLYYSPISTEPDYTAIDHIECLLSVKLPKAEQNESLENPKIDEEETDTSADQHPDTDMLVYYNTNGGQRYHADPNCPSVAEQYRPLTGSFHFSEINSDIYRVLKPCRICNPPARPIP